MSSRPSPAVIYDGSLGDLKLQKLEEERITEITGLAGKNRGKEKLKLILISQVLVKKNDT